MSGFRGSNLTITMANREALESLEPLNPLTPDPDFGNLFCVFWQAKGKVQFLVSPCQALPAGSYREMAIWRVHCCSSLLVNSNVPNIFTVYLSGRLLENANMEALRNLVGVAGCSFRRFAHVGNVQFPT